MAATDGSAAFSPATGAPQKPAASASGRGFGDGPISDSCSAAHQPKGRLMLKIKISADVLLIFNVSPLDHSRLSSFVAAVEGRVENNFQPERF
jgi:hypothetical protein